jgi:hypothetical protein
VDRDLEPWIQLVGLCSDHLNLSQLSCSFLIVDGISLGIRPIWGLEFGMKQAFYFN